MKKAVLKTLCNEVQAWLDEKGAMTADRALAGIPLIAQLRSAISDQRSFVETLVENANIIEKKCAEYADNHSTFIEMSEERSGQRGGEIVIDGDVYRYSVSPGELKRKGGGILTQEYLKALPKNWVKTKLELDRTAIKQEKVDKKTLEEYGLIRPTKKTWSLMV